MNVLSIKIKIANREYPMTISPEDEQVIRSSAHSLNQAVREYQKKFGTYDYQSLLSMAALGLVADLFKEKHAVADVYRELLEQVRSVRALTA